jgi:hypothetical protein
MAVALRAAREQAANTDQRIESLATALAQTQEELRALRAELTRRAPSVLPGTCRKPLRSSAGA